MQKFQDDAILLAYAGTAAMRTLDLEEAEQYLARAHELNPKEPIISLGLGKLYFQKREYGIAREYLTDTIGIDQ